MGWNLYPRSKSNDIFHDEPVEQLYVQGSQFPFRHIFGLNSPSRGSFSDQILLSVFTMNKLWGDIEWIPSQMVCLLHSRAVSEKLKHPQFRLGAYIVHTSDLKSYSRLLQTFLCSAIFNLTISSSAHAAEIWNELNSEDSYSSPYCIRYAHCREEGCIRL